MSPYVVAMIGLPGAGKSTVASSLLQQFDLHEVNRDEIRAAMFPRCEYTRDEKEAAEESVLAAVRLNCRAGRNSIVDGMTFSTRASREKLRGCCEANGSRLVSIWLDCPASVAQQRVGADRQHAAADRTAELVGVVAERFDQPTGDAIRIDATAPVSAICVACADVLRSAETAASPHQI